MQILLKLTLLLPMIACGARADAAPIWLKAGLPDDLKPPPPVTAARWLWHAGRNADDTDCWYRYAFDVSAPVAKGTLALAWDDRHECYLNGERITFGQFASKVKAGRNVLAVHVKNILSMGGLIAFGDFALADGATFSLRSTRAFKVTETPPPANWFAPDFADEDWPAATEMGDAMMKPFSRHRDYMKDFATAAERAALAAHERAAKIPEVPATLERECDPDVKVVYRGFRPFVSVNGAAIEPDFALRMADSNWARSAIRKLSALGYRVFRLGASATKFEKAAGVYDFSELDRQAAVTLAEAPQAYFCLQLRLDFPKWCAEHPDDVIQYGDGPIDEKIADERVSRQRRPSAASAAYRAEVRRFFDALGAYVNAKPWRKRLVMVRPCWGIYTEWHTYGMYHAPDVGPAMAAAFQRRTGGRYAGQALPMAADRLKGGSLLDPKADRLLIDYYDCQANEVADLLVMCCGEAKRVFPGRLAGAYYGYVFSTHPPEGANVLLEKVLASPNVDYLSDPAPYTVPARRAGGCYPHRTVPATFRRHGKLAIVEDDMRFHHIADFCEKAICTSSPRESRVTACRDQLNKLFDGCGIQLLDPMSRRECRLFNFDDPDVMTGLDQARKAVAKVGRQMPASGNSLAVVISPRERLLRDGNPKATPLLGLIYVSALQDFYRSGVPFDLMTLEDYLAAPGDYRQVVFLNAFTLADAERTSLKAAVRRPGVTALWLVAPGCCTPEGFSDAAMSDLAGLTLVGAAREPKVTCTDPAARPTDFGGWEKALAGGAKTCFLAVPPKNKEGWHRAFTAIGAHALTPPGRYVRRHGDLILYHVDQAVKEEISLPPDYGGGKWIDELVYGTRIKGNKLFVETDGPETLLFRAVTPER